MNDDDAFDEIQEFTRVLRAREDQVKRGVGNGIAERRRGVKATVPGSTKEVASSKNTVKDEINAAGVAVANDIEADEFFPAWDTYCRVTSE